MNIKNNQKTSLEEINKTDLAEKFLEELKQGLYDSHSAKGLYEALVMFQFIEPVDFKLKKIIHEIVIILNKKIDNKLNSKKPSFEFQEE
ncbi:MAG: hypothetical protein ACP5OG_02960 [Candidatus Nanoarchaeia archaeon]